MNLTLPEETLRVSEQRLKRTVQVQRHRSSDERSPRPREPVGVKPKGALSHPEMLI